MTHMKFQWFVPRNFQVPSYGRMVTALFGTKYNLAVQQVNHEENEDFEVYRQMYIPDIRFGNDAATMKRKFDHSDFVLNNKVYNCNNPNKTLRRTLVNTNGPLNTMVPPKFPDKHLDPENAGRELSAMCGPHINPNTGQPFAAFLMTSAGNLTI